MGTVLDLFSMFDPELLKIDPTVFRGLTGVGDIIKEGDRWVSRTKVSIVDSNAKPHLLGYYVSASQCPRELCPEQIAQLPDRYNPLQTSDEWFKEIIYSPVESWNDVIEDIRQTRGKNAPEAEGCTTSSEPCPVTEARPDGRMLRLEGTFHALAADFAIVSDAQAQVIRILYKEIWLSEVSFFSNGYWTESAKADIKKRMGRALVVSGTAKWYARLVYCKNHGGMIPTE